MKNSEKRRELRRKGKFPIVLENGKGTTRDFSNSGIFFETDKSFTPGQTIDFTIVLEYVDPDRPVHLKCQGSIVRVEDKGKKLGIAATINCYAFDRSNFTNKRIAKKKIKKDIQKCH